MRDRQEPLSPPRLSRPSTPANASSSTPDQHKPRKRRTKAGEVEYRKRGRYVSRACETCKRRKLKCNGDDPCQRCVERSDECSYAAASPAISSTRHDCLTPNLSKTPLGRPSRDLENLTSLLLHMQEKIDSMEAKINLGSETAGSGSGRPSLFCAEQTRTPSDTHTLQKSTSDNVPLLVSTNPTLPGFSGPTSSNFSFDKAKQLLRHAQGSLEQMQDRYHEDDESQFSGDETPGKDEVNRTGPRDSLELLQEIGEDEALRLARVWEEVVGALHPIVDCALLKDLIRDTFRALDKGASISFRFSAEERELNILILILAIALLSEGQEHRQLSARLFASVRHALDAHIYTTSVDISGQVFMLLVGIYYFFRDEQRLASRIVAITARMTQEAGLHRREVLFRTFQNPQDRARAIVILWSIFVFDRQFSFAAGLPDSMKTNILDLPDVEGAPYLKAMTRYVDLGEKAWNSVTDRHGRVAAPPSKDTYDFFDYSIEQWENSLPECLHPRQIAVRQDQEPNGQEETRAIRCMRTLLHLRGNQMRMLIMRPILYSRESFMVYRERVSHVLEVARDTVRVLAHLDATSDIYRKQQVIFNHFLSSALSVFSLVLAHEPQQREQEANGNAEATSTMSLFSSAREEIFLALELVKSYSTYSSSSKRVWKTFSTLKELLSRLGLLRRDQRMEMMSVRTEHEIEFSEIFQHLGDDPQAFLGNHASMHFYPGGLVPSDSAAIPMTGSASWQNPHAPSLDSIETWVDPTGMNSLSSMFDEHNQLLGWNFQSLL